MIGPEPFLGTICNKFVLIKYDALGFYYLAVIGSKPYVLYEKSRVYQPTLHKYRRFVFNEMF